MKSESQGDIRSLSRQLLAAVLPLILLYMDPAFSLVEIRPYQEASPSCLQVSHQESPIAKLRQHKFLFKRRRPAVWQLKVISNSRKYFRKFSSKVFAGLTVILTPFAERPEDFQKIWKDFFLGKSSLKTLRHSPPNLLAQFMKRFMNS